MVVSSRLFAYSPAVIKSIPVSSGMSMTDANGVLTPSCSAPSSTGPLYLTGNVLDLDYGWGLKVDGTNQLIVDDGVIQEVLSYVAPLINSSNSVSLSYGSGLKLNGSQLVIDTSTIKPWFSPQLPLSRAQGRTLSWLSILAGP